MSVVQFGFDDADVVVSTDIPIWSQQASDRKSRVSVISFKTHLQVWVDGYMKEHSEIPTEDQINTKRKEIDEKLASHLQKKVEELTEVDRLNVQVPAFASSLVHYQQGVGSVQCLSKWEKGNRIKTEVCCEKMEEPKQKIACAIVHYTVLNNDLDPNPEILKLKEGMRFYAWVLNSGKYHGVKISYNEGRRQVKEFQEQTGQKKAAIFDLKVELDGDPKFQNQKTNHMNAAWAHQSLPKEISNFILERGLKIFKQLEKGNKHMGYELTREKLLTKLGSGGSSSASGQLGSGAESAERPALNSSYDELI